MHLLYDVVLYLSGDYAFCIPLFVEQMTLHQANELCGTSTHLPSFQTQTPWLRCVSQMKIQFPSGIVLVSFVPPPCESEEIKHSLANTLAGCSFGRSHATIAIDHWTVATLLNQRRRHRNPLAIRRTGLGAVFSSCTGFGRRLRGITNNVCVDCVGGMQWVT